MHKLVILVTIFVNIVSISCHTMHIRTAMSSIPARQVRQLGNQKQQISLDDCKYAVRQAEVNWDKIQIFCEYFYTVDGGINIFAESYFQTTSGTNFRHCRGTAKKNLKITALIYHLMTMYGRPTLL